MSSRQTENSKDFRADVVIIGGGGAGLAAAITAAENGAANIVVLEKRTNTGGNSVFIRGMFAAESPVQKRAGIDARRDDYFKTAMNYAYWKSNPRLVRAYVNKTGDTIGWLEDKGVQFNCEPLWYGQSPLVFHVPVGSGIQIMKTLADECQKLGINVLTSTSAKKLQIDTDGSITGVIAETEGNEISIATERVVIATGGYGGNKKLLKQYCPQYHDDLQYDGITDNTGDGLMMATGIGAATVGLGLLLIFGPRAPGSISIKFRSHPDKIPVSMGALAKEPITIFVNKKGQRFIDETAGGEHMAGHALVQQPEHVCFTLFDQNMVQIMTRGLLDGRGVHSVEQKKEMPGLEQELKKLADKGLINLSDSWDGIAQWIGAAPADLKTTINEYNAACDQGYDPIFAKDRMFLIPLRTPPYYAIKGGPTFGDTLGGVKINENMEVLDGQDNPIRGLYAAGLVSGGWEGDAYCPMLSGTTGGFAINSGRIAGEKAAKYVLAHGGK